MVALPPVFVATIVYVAVGEFSVGVPEIVPVELSNTRPTGKSGVIDQFSTVPPLDDGVSAVIAVPFVKV